MPSIVDLDALRRRQEYITERSHPALPLLIWNYNARCQYERAWDEYTRMARGLITDTEGRIVARGFPKFFNLNETEETRLENLPNAPHHVYEKLDGSLGILYWDGNEPCIATRGSFTSEQAQWATKWLRERVDQLDSFREGYTYLFEIIYPANRIVVDYGDWEQLSLLAAIETATGLELCPREEGCRLGITWAERFAFGVEEIAERCTRMGSNQEGFVVHYPSHGLRVKVKGEEYVRLHRLLTGFSSTSIWECLAAGQEIDAFLERVPDEFYAWVKAQQRDLLARRDEEERRARCALQEVLPLPDRKSQALHLMAHHKEIAPLVFPLLDGRDVGPMIWKRLKPERALPFRCAGG